MWRDNQPHGYSRPILFPHSAKRVRDCRQNHHDCRQNIPWLLWNALLTTPYISEHYKYMFLVARDLYEMFVLYRRKHTTRRSTVGIWSEVRVYRTPAANIPWAGVLRLGKFPDNRRWMCICTWTIKACRCSSSIRCRILRAYEKMTHLTRRGKNELTQMRTLWLSCCFVLSFFDLYWESVTAAMLWLCMEGENAL